MPPDTPLILAFDTSAAQCAVALLAGDEILASACESMSKGQAERLFPLLEEVLQSTGKIWSDLDAIGVGIGPGNFTGIRISVSAARGLALALNIPAIGVSTLEALAANSPEPTLVCLDARRERVYTQLFNSSKQPPEMQEISQLNATSFEPSTTVVGFNAKKIAENIGCLPGPQNETAAPEVIAKIAKSKLGENNNAPAPLYLRAADAALPAKPLPEILHDA